MGIVMIFKYGKRFRFTPSFNKRAKQTPTNKIFMFTLQSLTGKYRFFTGKSLCSNSILTCFGSVQGLKGQISLKYREVYAFCTGKTTTWNFAKTGKNL
jgi:hypothetical protein